MLDLSRSHDFQIFLSPSPACPAAVNPPGFHWPENLESQRYRLELENLTDANTWNWDHVNSPLQLSFALPPGQYRWRLVATLVPTPNLTSDWVEFQITDELPDYVAPTAKELFALCDDHNQWLMYFDQDIEAITERCTDIYPRLKQTAALSVPMENIDYPTHYRRGHEEGKREAIANVRKWIDRDLVAHALLFKIWGDEQHGSEAMQRLLQLAQWSPEGPASLLRPCTWGDEVGCSLARNLFLVYHWLDPLLNKSEKDFVRPMLIRIARQIRERLSQDSFQQYPGHSHTSRLPAYLGIAALALYREHDTQECEEWLSYALITYRSVLPFYGGADGSWVEGPFYASTYTKWYHPFFLSIERLSGFSFYEHPFYRNFLDFAQDFIVPEQAIHPFGDGFWCLKEGREWPGFFSQNPLRIYAARFGEKEDYLQSLALEESITDYRLHLLDVIPTINQIAYDSAVADRQTSEKELVGSQSTRHYYSHAGLGKLTQEQLSLYYRASGFGNSSHRHADQGNIALFDKDTSVLIPTGSYGYRFGSRHHSAWTRQTIAHNLPLIGEVGQRLDDHRAVGSVVQSLTEANYHVVTLDLRQAYNKPLARFYRTILLVKEYGLIVVDTITLDSASVVNWRLHSALDAMPGSKNNLVLLTPPRKPTRQYMCGLLNHVNVHPTLDHGYPDEETVPQSAIESDAGKSVVHLDWRLPQTRNHQVFACCIKADMPVPEIEFSINESGNEANVNLKLQQQIIQISYAID